MRNSVLLLLLLTTISTAAPVCPAGTAVAYFRLEARRPTTSYGIPIDRVNHLQKGDSVVFFPSDPPVPTDTSGARVALLLHTTNTNEFRLLETKKGNARQEWVLPEDAAAIAVAYGPRGFDEDRMKNAATKDPELIAQLAEYSEKTAQTEIVLSALTGRRQNDDRAVDAALQGLASTGGASKLDRTASLDQQTLSLFRTLNPAIGSYDPLAPEAQQRWQQSATLASSVAGLFFGNTVGLAGGGAALFLNMRSLMFPKTELRSALLREAPEPALCAAKTASTRTKVAYLWARRMPQGAPPRLALNKPVHLAIGQPAMIPIDAPDVDLLNAGRAFRWKLVDAKGAAVNIPISVPVNEKSLRAAQIPPGAKPGTYRLLADWDWTTVPVGGDIVLHPLPDLNTLRLTPDTADHLITNTGPIRARLAGAPAYFINSLQLLRLGDPLAKPAPIPYAASPEGDWVEFEVNTSSLPAGPYTLTIAQQGGGKAELALAIQPPAPAIDNLPIPVHEGSPETITISGKGLDRIEKLTSPHAKIDWDAASRQARVTLAEKTPPEIDIEAHVEGRHRPLLIANALRAAGPKPVITALTRAPQQAGTVERLDGEIDAAMPAAFSLKVKNLPPAATVHLTCKEPGATPPAAEAKPIGSGTLYVTVPANSPVPCTMSATVAGSNPASLGKTVSLPAITGFKLTNEPGVEANSYKGELTGVGLEAIAKTGWSNDAAREVSALPAPDGQGQKMEIIMPWPAPAPHAPLRIWLRGEAEPRLTTAAY
ncbi:MAG: hypothetical protein HYX27_22665 [Acidobacteria bacterium]|nr:hypothetical protein [Acidobacteriota bacterium]